MLASHESLKDRTLIASSWIFFESVGVQGARFVTGIILARLLSPEEFGLVAMVMVIIGVAQPFLDGGFGGALIQKKNINALDINSVFYFNIFLGFIFSLSIFFLAPCISNFFNQPLLNNMTRALSFVLLINSFGIIQIVILTKNLNFKVQTKANLIACLFSGTIGITMALLGFGVWSLVAQLITNALSSIFFLWFFNDWRPTLSFSLQSLRELFSFGSRLMASGILNIAFENLYSLMIGKLFSARDLGLFSRANNLQGLPSNTLARLVERVSFPVFSTLQDNRSQLKSGIVKTVSTISLLNFPLMIGMAAVSKSLVFVLLGVKWIECIPYLQLLCIVGLLYPLDMLNLNLLLSLGKSDLFLNLKIVKMFLIIINISFTWRFGIFVIILGMVAISIVLYILSSYYVRNLIGYEITEQLKNILPYMISSAIMGTIISALYYFLDNHIIILVTQIFVGVSIYILICSIFKLSAFMELWHIFRNKCMI